MKIWKKQKIVRCIHCFNQSWREARATKKEQSKRWTNWFKKITGQNISNNKLLDNGGSQRRWIIHYSFIFLASFLCSQQKNRRERSLDRFIKRCMFADRRQKRKKERNTAETRGIFSSASSKRIIKRFCEIKKYSSPIWTWSRKFYKIGECDFRTRAAFKAPKIDHKSGEWRPKKCSSSEEIWDNFNVFFFILACVSRRKVE